MPDKSKKIEPVRPTIKYIEDVCKKASTEGFKLEITGMWFAWKDKAGKVTGANWNLSPGLLMLEACIFLEKQEKWTIPLE